MSAAPASPAGGTVSSNQWLSDVHILSDALAPRQPTQYIVSGLFALPSLNIVYGAPGCLKSMLLADMAVCVAGNIPWLQGSSWDLNPPSPFLTKRFPVLWFDQDNGGHRTANRFEALARHYGLTLNIPPLYYLSMPKKPLDAGNAADLVQLIDLIRTLGARLVVVDNLLTVSGGRDENSAEIALVMTNLRFASEQTGAAIVVVHHSRKANGFKGKEGEDLRGHSSLRGAIDTGLNVAREPNSDNVTIKSTKTRDVEIADFGATWHYLHKSGCNDLEEACFYGAAVATNITNNAIQAAVLAVLRGLGPNSGGLNQTVLVSEVHKTLPKAGDNRIRNIIRDLAASQKIVEKPGTKPNEKLYSL